MTRLLLALLLLAAPQAWGAVSFVRSGGATQANGFNTTVTASLTVTAGNTVVIFGYADGTETFNTPTSTAGDTFSAASSVQSGAGSTKSWTCLSVGSATAFTLTTTNSASFLTIMVLEYSGVTAIGTNTTASSGGSSVTTLSLTLTTQDTNNYVIGAMVPYNYTGATLTYNTGTGRESCNDNTPSCTATPQNGSKTFVFAGDVTNASAASTTLRATWSTSGVSNGVAVELRSGGGGGPTPPAHSGMTGFWGYSMPRPAAPSILALPPDRRRRSLA